MAAIIKTAGLPVIRLALFFCLWITSCSETENVDAFDPFLEETAAPPVPVKTVIAALEPFKIYIELNGSVRAASSIAIYPLVNGIIQSINYETGEQVKKGSAIMTIDASRPGENFSHSPIYSTVAGTVTSLPFKVGDTVGIQTAAVVVSDLSVLYIDLFVAERYAVAVEYDMPALLTFAGIDDSRFTARVSEIEPQIDPATRTLKVTLRLDPDERLRPGMYAAAQLIFSNNDEIALPIDAVRTDAAGSRYLYLLDGERAQRRQVVPGQQSDGLIIIRDGISAGDEVVISGHSALSENAEIVRR